MCSFFSCFYFLIQFLSLSFPLCRSARAQVIRIRDGLDGGGCFGKCDKSSKRRQQQQQKRTKRTTKQQQRIKKIVFKTKQNKKQNNKMKTRKRRRRSIDAI